MTDNPTAEAGQEAPFYQDKVTGEPCVRRGPVLCHSTDPNHLHVAVHMVTAEAGPLAGVAAIEAAVRRELAAHLYDWNRICCRCGVTTPLSARLDCAGWHRAHVAAAIAATLGTTTAETGLRERVEALCDEAEYVVLATDDPGCAPVKAVAEIDLRAALTAGAES